MSHRYVYARKAAASDPVKFPAKRWGLFQADNEITEAEAAEIYASDPANTDKWFGIIRLEDGADRPSAYLQMCPGANGVEMHRLGPAGSVDAAYGWGRWDTEGGSAAEPRKVFLNSITWYAYPDKDQFWRLSQSVGTVNMTFWQDGRAKEDVVTHGTGADPDQVTTTESKGVDMSANWVDVPEFGDWERFFSPEG